MFRCQLPTKESLLFFIRLVLQRRYNSFLFVLSHEYVFLYNLIIFYRLERFCEHMHACPWAQGLAVRLKAIGKIFWIRDRSKNQSVTLQCNEALALLGHVSPPPNRGIRILSIDGGGMRGLIALEILKAIELQTGQRIHETFDLICGVSTGAIMASFLGFHKKSILDVEKTYSTLGFKIFTQNFLEGELLPYM